jgi:S-adenosylmethionine:tRNA ribosyltransferase-isomerase
MKLSDFRFDLPAHLIAQVPKPERTESRLLAMSRQTGEVQHHVFSDLPNLLRAGDLLVFNNTRVIPARLYGQKETGGKIEMLIERIINDTVAAVHMKSSHAPKPGQLLRVSSENFSVRVLEREDDLFILEFIDAPPLLDLLKQYGQIPLPTYITRDPTQKDLERYQTVYATTEGAVAAPTAGLHFDDKLLSQLKIQGCELAYVTLHVGAGTFQPVRVDNIHEHRMHHEWFEMTPETAARINQAKAEGRRIIAVGTTSVRVLESVAQAGRVQATQGETDIFIYPGYEWKIVDSLITNFHVPESSLIMLVSAFAGYEAIMRAYQIAIEQEYRFFSYGDAMAIL